ncbi:MAG: NAD-dependent epimerase/dehydratase family protein [Anaerolineae bacterium]|nr:NAD-dependent epimerase/dehydratase family protein [Anaerolineae bacterium]
MHILILGGTKFLGRHLVNAALARGHRLTLFHRGNTLANTPNHDQNAALWAEVEHIHGNRDGGLAALAGRTWDAAIDTCGYVPRVVRQSALALAEVVQHYTFISSISVYADTSQPGTREDAPAQTLADESNEVIDGNTYGGLKALCEREVLTALPDRALVLRPGLIVGPFDPSDRFTYWVRRVGQGGGATSPVLAPGRPERVVQFIDVRDLAEWNIRLVEARQTGVFNVTGPAQPVSFGKVLAACQRASANDAVIHWVDEATLAAHKVQPWSDLPLWLPESDPAYAGFMHIDCSAALAHGLTFRALDDTVAATLGWDRTRPQDVALRAGLGQGRETAILSGA